MEQSIMQPLFRAVIPHIFCKGWALFAPAGLLLPSMCGISPSLSPTRFDGLLRRIVCSRSHRAAAAGFLVPNKHGTGQGALPVQSGGKG